MIRFTCATCGKSLHVGDEHAGVRVRCPNCQSLNDAPLSSTLEAPESPPAAEPKPHALPLDEEAEDEAPRPRKRRSPDDLPMPAETLQSGVEILRGKLGGNFFSTVERTANFIGIYGLLAFSPIAAIMGLVALVSKDMRQSLPDRMGLELLLFCLLIPVSQYIVAKVRRAGIRIITSSRSATSSTNILDCFAVLLLLGVIAALAYGIYRAIDLGDWNEGIVWCIRGLLASFVCLVMAGLTLNPGVLNVRVAPGLSAGGEAMGLVSFLLKLLLRIAPLALAVLVAIGFFQLVNASYVAAKSTSTGIFAVVTHGVCILLFAFTAAYLGLYLVFLTYHLTVDVILAIFRIAANTQRLAPPKEAAPPESEAGAGGPA